MHKISMLNLADGDLEVKFINGSKGIQTTYQVDAKNAEYIKSLNNQQLIEFINNIQEDVSNSKE